MARKGFRTVEISRFEARELAAWVRHHISRFTPTLLSDDNGANYAADWHEALMWLDRVGKRRARGRPRLPVEVISKLVAHLEAIIITRSVPSNVLNALLKIRGAILERGRPAYRTSNNWFEAEQRTLRGLGSDCQNLAGKQRRNAKKLEAWEAWSAKGNTLLTINHPLPAFVIPRSRKNRPI